MNDFSYDLSVSEFLCVWNNLQEKDFRNLSVLVPFTICFSNFKIRIFYFKVN